MGVHPSEDSEIRHPPSSLHPFSPRDGPSHGKVGEEDPAHSPQLKGQSAKPASLGGLPHWGERWVATPPYSVHGNTEGRSRSETPGSLLEREVGLKRMNWLGVCKLCFFLASQRLLKDPEFPQASKFWEGWNVRMGERGVCVCGGRWRVISSTLYFFPGFRRINQTSDFFFFLRFPLDRGIGGGREWRECLFRTQIKLLEEVFIPADLLPPRSCPPPPPWLGNQPQNGKLLRKKNIFRVCSLSRKPQREIGERNRSK